MYKILLIGDDCIDEYQYGTVDRISPEAPVPVFKLLFKETKSGMASNVKENLINLGCDVFYILGKQSIKTRFIDVKSNQHIVRVDHDVLSNELEINEVKHYSVDAIVVSDYNKGFVSYELVESLVKLYPNTPIFVDTKKDDLARFEGCIVKINSDENHKAKSYCSDLIVTLGRHGARYNHNTYNAQKVEVVDVCGAGDTFLAALVVEYLNTLSIDMAIKFAINASAVTVQHMGVYAPTMEEIHL